MTTISLPTMLTVVLGDGRSNACSRSSCQHDNDATTAPSFSSRFRASCQISIRKSPATFSSAIKSSPAGAPPRCSSANVLSVWNEGGDDMKIGGIHPGSSVPAPGPSGQPARNQTINCTDHTTAKVIEYGSIELISVPSWRSGSYFRANARITGK